jgi:hypothetical protein
MVVTFLISSNFSETASVLDDRRLLKQRVEAYQIINAIELGKGWINHPATKMWVGYTDALKEYYNIMVLECIKRGKNNNMELYKDLVVKKYPKWIYNEKVHNSHKARLIAKDFEYYSTKISVPDIYHNYGYIWPSKFTNNELNILNIKLLAEKKIEIVFCNGIIKKTSKKCKNKALKNKLFCGLHCKNEK